MGRLNTTWNSVKQRALAWSVSRSHGGLHNIHYAHETTRDSIEHVKKCLFGKFHGGSIGRASVFYAKVVESHPGHFFFLFFLIPVIA